MGHLFIPCYSKLTEIGEIKMTQGPSSVRGDESIIEQIMVLEYNEDHSVLGAFNLEVVTF